MFPYRVDREAPALGPGRSIKGNYLRAGLIVYYGGMSRVGRGTNKRVLQPRIRSR